MDTASNFRQLLQDYFDLRAKLHQDESWVGKGLKKIPLKKEVEKCMENLKNAFVLPASFQKAKSSIGKGRATADHHLTFLPFGQKVKNGIYIAMCFNREGTGCVFGCCRSKELEGHDKPEKECIIRGKKLKNGFWELQSPKKVDVHDYNNTFYNPLEITVNSLQDEDINQKIQKHFLESIDLCNRLLDKKRNNISGDLFSVSEEKNDSPHPDNNQTAFHEKKMRYNTKEDNFDMDNIPLPKWRQLILFGAPGTGKSYRVDQMVSEDGYVFRTTFHPDYDYAQFVGAYKPIQDSVKGIIYDFRPQVFLDAYMAAWKGLQERPVKTSVLVIEEINRGNCASVFGDIFQLLDRYDSDEDGERKGYSRYPVKANADLADWLQNKSPWSKIKPEWLKEDELCFPSNFSVIATMNTSDQSLFPMDSAFRRRWQWEYVPINLSEDSDQNAAAAYEIEIGKKKYSWIRFLKAINPRILELTASEDKQLGTYFITGSVDTEEFVSKVVFYLWNDICKDEYKANKDNFMRTNCRHDDNNEFTFNELFSSPEGKEKILQGFMDYLMEHSEDENGRHIDLEIKDTVSDES